MSSVYLTKTYLHLSVSISQIHISIYQSNVSSQKHTYQSIVLGSSIHLRYISPYTRPRSQSLLYISPSISIMSHFAVSPLHFRETYLYLSVSHKHLLDTKLHPSVSCVHLTDTYLHYQSPVPSLNYISPSISLQSLTIRPIYWSSCFHLLDTNLSLLSTCLHPSNTYLHQSVSWTVPRHISPYISLLSLSLRHTSVTISLLTRLHLHSRLLFLSKIHNISIRLLASYLRHMSPSIFLCLYLSDAYLHLSVSCLHVSTHISIYQSPVSISQTHISIYQSPVNIS